LFSTLPIRGAEQQPIDLGATATGYELECLLKLQEAYREINVTIKDAIAQLDKWAPGWNSNFYQLGGDFTDEEKTLRFMNVELQREHTKFDQVKAEREYWEASLPPDGSEVNERGSVAYRRERISRLETEETDRAYRIEEIKQNIAAQEERVEELRRDVIPSLSVVDHAKSSYDLLSRVEEMLHQEYSRIIARLPRPINKVPSDIWLHIFFQTINLQEEDNGKAIESALPLEDLKSPGGWLCPLQAFAANGGV